MELEKRIEILESKIIDALAEARTARLIAEKALEKKEPPIEHKEPWIEPPQVTPTASVTVQEITPRPTLSAFYNKRFEPKQPQTENTRLEEELWDEMMEEEHAG